MANSVPVTLWASITYPNGELSFMGSNGVNVTPAGTGIVSISFGITFTFPPAIVGSQTQSG
jgi:hypothetical protein